MKSIKKALCYVLICFGAYMFCTSTASAAEGAEVNKTKAADNNFVDNNVTEEDVTDNRIKEKDFKENDVRHSFIRNIDNNESTEESAAPEYGVTDNGSAPTGAPAGISWAQPLVTEAVPLAAEVQTQPEDVQSETVVLKQEDNTEVAAGGEKSKNRKTAAKNRNNKNKGRKKYNKADLRLLSALIYCEAGVEPYAGKVGVGIVVMNRVKSSSFPDSVKKVIYQKSQFSPAHNGMLGKALARYDAGKFNSRIEKQCIRAAKAALDGVKTVTYAGSTKNMKRYHYFSGGLSGAKLTIKGHKFK